MATSKSEENRKGVSKREEKIRTIEATETVRADVQIRS
jgi:hypothetical protein